MIKNTIPARNCPKGKEPILTMAMQIAGGGGGVVVGGGGVEQWPFSVGEVRFLL